MIVANVANSLLTCKLLWLQERKLTAYSISGGPSLLYNNFFPKHKERLDKKLSELMKTVAKLVLPYPLTSLDSTCEPVLIRVCHRRPRCMAGDW